tara:strand:- start:4442 stop:5476 length:1035 start_codon:yes stop_codon:yes gene_type:complete
VFILPDRGEHIPALYFLAGWRTVLRSRIAEIFMNSPSFFAPFAVTAPIFLIILLGILLHWRKIINDDFVTTSSRLVFTVALPILMFRAIVMAELDLAAHLDLVVCSLVAAVLAPLLVILWARCFHVAVPAFGAFVQAAFRSNLGIIGLAVCIAAYGDSGAALGALILAAVTPVYNLISVLVLSKGHAPDWQSQLRGIITNPLIVAILLAIPFQLAGIRMAPVFDDTARLVAQLTLPLALLGVGASLNASLRGSFNSLVLQISLLKLILLPAIITAGAYLAGIRGEELNVLAIMFASPTAAASFVMARAMGGDALLTARAIAVTTLGALVTISVFLYVLDGLPLV